MKFNEKGERASVGVLRECIELQNRKGADYQAEESTVKQADYYPNGIITIHDIMHTKMLRIKSLMEKEMSGGVINFESLEDSAQDLINYASFFIAYCRGEVDGQNLYRNKYNRKVVSGHDHVQKVYETISKQEADISGQGFNIAASPEWPDETLNPILSNESSIPVHENAGRSV